MKKFTFYLPLKQIDVLATDVKKAFLKLGKKARLTFKQVYCEETGEELSDVEVYALFGCELSL